MRRITIRRSKNKPLTFSGTLLGEVSTRHRRERWTELRLYRVERSTIGGDAVELLDSYTPSEGSYVAEQVGRSLIDGEIDRVKAWPCRTKQQVREALGDGPLARELYTQAGFNGAESVGPQAGHEDERTDR